MAKRTKQLTSPGEEWEKIRINKFLSEAGICSRREADRYIMEGKIKIDGVIARMGSKVGKSSQVTLCDKPVKREDKLILIAFNKPEGIVCTTDLSEPDNIIDYINYGMRIYPVGRLDKDSEGLILLTNDGNIVNKILRAENGHEKEYVVTVNKEINSEFIKGMSSGVPVLDTVTKPCTVIQLDKNTFSIILTQGLNRQIRRMCEYFGYRVVSLKRIRIMNIPLGRLKTGDYRNVTEKEIEELKRNFQEKSEFEVEAAGIMNKAVAKKKQWNKIAETKQETPTKKSSGYEQGTPMKKSNRYEQGTLVKKSNGYEQGTPVKKGNRYDQGTPVKKSNRYDQGTSEEKGNRYGQEAPVKKGNRYDQGTPVKKGNRYEQGTPVKKSNRYKQEAPVKKSNRYEQGTSAKKGNRYEQEAPVKKGNRYEQGTPVKKGNRYEQEAPVKKGNKYEQRISVKKGNGYETRDTRKKGQ